MKIISILGSPDKKGTSATIAAGFMERAETLGADTRTYYLNGMKFKGCQGCNACKSEAARCILKDDLTEVLDGLMAADVAIFAAPVYYGDVSGQFKTFFDRTWSLVKPDFESNPAPCRLPDGKKALLVVSQGYGPEKHHDVIEKYSHFLTMYGYDLKVIRTTGDGRDPMERLAGCRAEAMAYADQIIG